ncbi:hypothetical protein PSP6_280010 [Paraburkholderia tropica]|nr:hypothetical protein PSP6_280010 [Paraburkholderia tropica]
MTMTTRIDHRGARRAPASGWWRLAPHRVTRAAPRFALTMTPLAFAALSLASPWARAQTAPAANGEVLPAVTVSGANDADATTEGSGSYAAKKATIGGKVAQSIKETPNSVSVLTRQQMDDQNVTTIQDALRYVTGVSSIDYGDGTAYFRARGSQLGIEFDGVPTLSGLQYQLQFDLAMYDRVEILRGPGGSIDGMGEPGGVVNLVRKRPQDQFHLATETQVDSFGSVRQMIDVTGPLNKDGTVRARGAGGRRRHAVHRPHAQQGSDGLRRARLGPHAAHDALALGRLSGLADFGHRLRRGRRAQQHAHRPHGPRAEFVHAELQPELELRVHLAAGRQRKPRASLRKRLAIVDDAVLSPRTLEGVLRVLRSRRDRRRTRAFRRSAPAHQLRLVRRGQQRIGPDPPVRADAHADHRRQLLGDDVERAVGLSGAHRSVWRRVQSLRSERRARRGRALHLRHQPSHRAVRRLCAGAHQARRPAHARARRARSLPAGPHAIDAAKRHRLDHERADQSPLPAVRGAAVGYRAVAHGLCELRALSRRTNGEHVFGRGPAAAFGRAV